MANKITYGILGLISLILIGGGAYYLTPEQLDASSTCTSTNITGIFESFSKSNVTGYWTENGTTKSSVCTKGKWIPTKDWLTLNNLTAKDIVIGPLDNALFDEFGNPYVINKTIYVDKSGKVNINGTVYDVDYIEKPPKIKCICDIVGGCKIKDCLI